MNPPEQRRHLLTVHGTLLAIDRTTGALCHRAVTDTDPAYRLLETATSATPDELAGVRAASIFGDPADTVSPGRFSDAFVARGFLAGALSLSAAGQYCTALPDGGFSWATSNCRQWESFLLLSADDVAALRHLMTESWKIEGSEDATRLQPVRLGANFSLLVAPHSFYLPDILPLRSKCTDDSFELTDGKPRGTAIFGRRAGAAAQRRAGQKTIWIDPLGNTGNRALQYLAAEGIRQYIPQAIIENIRLPEWGIVRPAPGPHQATATRTAAHSWIDTPGLADCLRRGVIDSVILDGYPFHMDHYPPRNVARSLLGPTSDGTDAQGFGRRELVCSVRAGEILSGLHRHYFPLPPAYYQLLAERSGLDLVFFGQLGDDPYSQSLQAAFPDARFIRGRSPGHDFDVLRRSANIAPSISTFAWLAAWLGEAESVYLPVGGLFSPVQAGDQMYLPIDDPAYQFILLPFTHSVNLWRDPAGFAAQQDLVAHCARPVDAAELREICTRARLMRPYQVFVGGFDPAFYLKAYAGVTPDIASGAQSALEHYLMTGLQQRRRPVELDEAFYLREYPDVAMGIAEGLFANPMHHYTATGWKLGYLPRPERAERS